MAEPYCSEHDDYIERYERTGEARAIGRIRTVTARRKNGESFPIELSVTKIAEDQDVQYAAFIRDISEKTKLQQKLVQNERLAAIGATAAKIAPRGCQSPERNGSDNPASGATAEESGACRRRTSRSDYPAPEQ